MCVTSMTCSDPYPVTTNVGIGQCAGVAGAGAEIHTHPPQKTLIPASVAAAADAGDDAASAFDLLFATSGSDYTPCEEMQMVLQEFVADPEGRSVALRSLSLRGAS